MSISGSIINTTFSYDNNGNQTGGLSRTISWTSYNKPGVITQGARQIQFYDDTDHQRFQQLAPEGTTLYFDAFGVHAEVVPAAASKTTTTCRRAGAWSACVSCRTASPSRPATSSRTISARSR
jgi:hypothetical protein